MLKKITCNLIAFSCFFLFLAKTNAQTFSDVYSNHPYYSAIESLSNQGIISGYPDGTFKPDNAINRVEILKLLLLSANIDVEDTTYNAGFPDVISNSWYAKYVVKAKDKDIIKGNPDGYFYPENQVNFAEALKMLRLSTNITSLPKLTENPFADVPKETWFAPYFAYAKSIGIIKKNSNENAEPSKLLDRGEVAQLISLFQQIEEITGTNDKTKETTEKQIATYYADIFNGKATASGEIFDQSKFTAAHKTLAFGTQLKVTNLENNESVIVTVNDRGPYASDPSYVLDLSKTAFQAISPLSRGIIEIKYEILDEEKETKEKIPDTNTASTETVELKTEENLNSCQNIYTKRTIATDFFDNVILDQPIPQIFQLNEVYNVSGTINTNEYTPVFIFLSTDKDSVQEKFKGDSNNGKFEITLTFKKTGKYKMGIIKGLTGNSLAKEIEVISPSCSPAYSSETIAPSDSKIEYANETTKLSWDNHQQKLSKIKFQQGTNAKTYLINNGQSSFNIPYEDFADFSTGEVSYTIYSANSLSNFSIDQSSKWIAEKTKTFSAVKHHQVFNNFDNIELYNIPGTYTLGKSISISGRTIKPLNSTSYIILPSGLTESIKLLSNNQIITSETIPSNTNFTFNFTPSSQGTYIVEINQDAGNYIINMPIYENNSIPLIPDIWDTNQEEIPEENFSLVLDDARNKLLSKINKSRTEFGANPIILDDSLTQLAQARSKDMKENNYLSHQNLNGLYANDLKINYNIKSLIGENLSINTDLEFTHADLMRSPGHRSNILFQKWTRIGIGISVDDEGELIVVEEFSNEELDETDLPYMRSQILQTMNLNRSEELLSDSNLDEIAQEWSENMINRDIWFEDPDTGFSLGYLISSEIDLDKQNSSMIVKGSFEPILEKLSTNDTVLEEKWKKVGSGISQNQDGNLNITIIYSD